MATKKKAASSGRKHKNWGGVVAHKRKVNGVNPAVVGATKKRRKKKIGFVTGSELGDVAVGFVGGFVVAVVANKTIDGMEKPKAYGETAIGAACVAISLRKGKSNPMLLGFGLGMGSVGVMGVAKDLGVIEGTNEFMGLIGWAEIGAGEDTMVIKMNGTDVENLMNGDNPAVIGNEAGNEMMSGQNPSVIGFGED